MELLPDHQAGVCRTIGGGRDSQAGPPPQHHQLPRLLVQQHRVYLYHRADDLWHPERVSAHKRNFVYLGRTSGSVTRTDLVPSFFDCAARASTFFIWRNN